jgi:hypothetical protein
MQTIITYEQEVIQDKQHAIAIAIVALGWPFILTLIACLWPFSMISKFKKNKK